MDETAFNKGCWCGQGNKSKDDDLMQESCRDGSRKSRCPCVARGIGCTNLCRCINCTNIMQARVAQVTPMKQTLDEKLNLMIFALKTNLRQIWCQICPPIKCPKCETNLLSHLSWGNVRQMWFKYAIIFALVQRYLKTRQIREK